jgi:hypothetical protein
MDNASEEAKKYITANPSFFSDSQQPCDLKDKSFVVDKVDSPTRTLSLSGSPPPIRKCIRYPELSRAVAPVIAGVDPPPSIQLPINHYYGPYSNGLRIDLGLPSDAKKLNVGPVIWVSL